MLRNPNTIAMHLTRPTITLIASLLLPILTGCVSTSTLKPTHGVSGRDAPIDAIRVDSHTPALAAAVVRDGQIAHLAALGYTGLDGNSPITPEHAFQLASVSKLFTTQAIIQLTHTHDLSLDDPVSRWIPELTDSQVTIRHLLTHTSGIRDTARAEHRNTQQQTDAYFRSALTTLPQHPANSHWSYTDAAFNLLGIIIERVTGETYEQYMNRAVFTPLGMDHTHASLDPTRLTPNYHTSSMLGGIKEIEHPFDRAFAPSSGIQSSASDIARWMIAVLDRAHSTGLTADDWEKLWKPTTATRWDGIQQGIGWQLEQRDTSTLLYRHAGQETGVASLLTLYPDQRAGIFIVGNSDELARFEIRSLLEKMHLGSTE